MNTKIINIFKKLNILSIHLYSVARLTLYLYIILSFLSQLNVENLFIDIISQFGFYIIFFGLLIFANSSNLLSFNATRPILGSIVQKG